MTRHRRNENAEFEWLMKVEKQQVGDYILDHYIGRGKIGYVYKAHFRDIPDIERAVKLIPNLKPGWDTEIRKVSKLSKVSSVVHFHHIDSETIRLGRQTALVQYTVWDYIHPGRNLRTILNDSPSISASFSFAIVETILRVLHACRALGILRHGDLHPGNILIGERDDSQLDFALQPVEPVYVSDFGYGATEFGPKPKNDYHGLTAINDALVRKINWETANSSDRQLIVGTKTVLQKILAEGNQSELTAPKEILEALLAVKSQAGRVKGSATSPQHRTGTPERRRFSVGSYQVSEMLGDDWALWNSLFVPTVPARSRILEPDITSVVTGPRGCGKTMLFRRLSERLVVECGPIMGEFTPFIGIYINANDISDAFSTFPGSPDKAFAENLYGYLHLCILSDFLAVEAAKTRIGESRSSAKMHQLLVAWLGQPTDTAPLVSNEDPIERYRARLEQIKNSFLTGPAPAIFPARQEFTHHTWLKRFVPVMREACPWMGQRTVFFFLDDYTTPRVSVEMQRILNRVLFQRSHEFVFKIATEAATTFLSEDSVGKTLQDGDDYRLVDLGEEALFMSEDERQSFLNQVFGKRLSSDQRIAPEGNTLPGLLGGLGLSKTAFARSLRSELEQPAPQTAGTLRGATRRRTLYHGHDVFTCLWSGDTRLMIQLLQDLVESVPQTDAAAPIKRVLPEDQDRAFRNRGSLWLDMQTRNQPTDAKGVQALLNSLKIQGQAFKFAGGSYGGHLKAVVEAFKDAARLELLGPVYVINEKGGHREVPRMAFRIEITDEFRVEGLAAEIYRDLIRYGLFMRDARGKSIRGAMVPRLYLRRLLLPYCLLALSKRDSVSMSCDWFRRLLLDPDGFRGPWETHRRPITATTSEQRTFGFAGALESNEGGELPDQAYNDLAEGE